MKGIQHHENHSNHYSSWIIIFVLSGWRLYTEATSYPDSRKHCRVASALYAVIMQGNPSEMDRAWFERNFNVSTVIFHSCYGRYCGSFGHFQWKRLTINRYHRRKYGIDDWCCCTFKSMVDRMEEQKK